MNTSIELDRYNRPNRDIIDFVSKFTKDCPSDLASINNIVTTILRFRSHELPAKGIPADNPGQFNDILRWAIGSPKHDPHVCEGAENGLYSFIDYLTNKSGNYPKQTRAPRILTLDGQHIGITKPFGDPNTYTIQNEAGIPPGLWVRVGHISDEDYTQKTVGDTPFEVIHLTTNSIRFARIALGTIASVNPDTMPDSPARHYSPEMVSNFFHNILPAPRVWV